MARTGQPSRERIASSRRTLAILDVLAEEGPLGTNEIARRLGTTASTVSRQLGTLVESDYVEHVPETGKYRLGIHLVRVASLVLMRLDVRAVARPHLEALVEETGETATLSLPGDPDAVTIDFVPAPHQVQGVTQLGRPSVAHATAAGKVMLAFTGRRPRPPLRFYTGRTITEVAALEDELELVRRRGWAEAYEEREAELNAIAAPVFGNGGTLAGILALQGPVPRFGRTPARKAVAPLVARAQAISDALGSTSS
ncbi:MAG TPA: IclR family transcriptional regulator [Gaiellaceae bacterium]|nr:IclR family transcriptional regulator [Gaiellaceae bacterium]